MVFEYKTTSSEFAISLDNGTGGVGGALGTVIMATDYNANNPPFSSKREMENYQHAVSGPPTKSMMHAVEVGSQVPINPYFIRLGEPTEKNYDLRFYDYGKFSIATSNNRVQTLPDGTPLPQQGSIGELWVTYEVELYKPKYRVTGTKMDHFTLANINGYNTLGTGQKQARPITTLAYFDINTPTPPFGFSNGTGNIGCWITSDGTATETDPINCNRLHFPNSSAGKTYYITMSFYILPGSLPITNVAFGNVACVAKANITSTKQYQTANNDVSAKDYPSFASTNNNSSTVSGDECFTLGPRGPFNLSYQWSNALLKTFVDADIGTYLDIKIIEVPNQIMSIV